MNPRSSQWPLNPSQHLWTTRSLQSQAIRNIGTENIENIKSGENIPKEKTAVTTSLTLKSFPRVSNGLAAGSHVCWWKTWSTHCSVHGTATWQISLRVYFDQISMLISCKSLERGEFHRQLTDHQQAVDVCKSTLFSLCNCAIGLGNTSCAFSHYGVNWMLVQVRSHVFFFWHYHLHLPSLLEMSNF